MKRNSAEIVRSDFFLNDETFLDNNISDINSEENFYPSRLSSGSILSYNSNSSISNFRFSIDSNSSFNENIIKKTKSKKNKKPKYIFCQKCKKFFLIEFDSNNFLNFECDCEKINNCTIDKFIKEYTFSDQEEVEKNINCKNHINKKYFIYCKDCKCDLCEECINEVNEAKIYSKFNIIIKKHETHGKIYLEEEINKEIGKIKSQIKTIKGNLSKGEIDIRRIFNLIINLIKTHKNYFCYNIYKSLANASEFLSNYKIPILKKMIKIKTFKELEENINSNNFIISIKIINQKLSDLSAFKNVNLEFLTELNLNENEIEDISPLENCNFQNLIYFDIETNKLNNKCLDIFKKISLPNVIWLNLFQNDIKSTEILEIIKNYKNLESFFIGENKFDKSELQKNKIYDFPSKLKEFGLTGNLTQETIDFILKLKIEKLEILYISRNQLNNLSFIKNIKFEKLKEFWVSFNNIVDLKEIENLQYKETIKRIILKGNKISNIENILDVVKNFKNLKEINLENNPIKLINDNILQKLKEKEIQLKI